MAELKRVTLFPERNKVPENRRVTKRQTTLRAFTFVRDWELRVSPIPVIVAPGTSQNGTLSPISRISPGPIVIEAATQRSRRSRQDDGDFVSSQISFRQPGTPLSQRNSHGQDWQQNSSINKPTMESTRLSMIVPDVSQECLEARTETSLKPSQDSNSDSSINCAGKKSMQSSDSGPSTRRSATRNVSTLKKDRFSSPRNRDVRAQSPAVEAAQSPFAETSQSPIAVTDQSPIAETSQSPIAETDQSPVAETDQSPVAETDQSPVAETDQSPIVEASQSHTEEYLTVTPVRPKEGACATSKHVLAVVSSPKSGPGVRSKAGVKRTLSTTTEKQTTEPKKGKVCLWTATDRSRTASDITHLDVVLSNIEQICLDYREDLTQNSHRKAISKFFTRTKKDFTDMIALQQEDKFLQSALRKSKTDVNRKRKLLLSLQQEQARLAIDANRLRKKQENNKQKTLQELSCFLEDLENLHLSVNDHGKDDEQDFNHKDNIPALLMEADQMQKVSYNLRSSNRKMKNRPQKK